MEIRADRLGGVLYYAESSDGGKSWPAFATKTAIRNPGSKATLYGLGGETVALLHNPNPKHRSPMSLWISFDGMTTWPYRRVLQAESCDGPKGRMNYPDRDAPLRKTNSLIGELTISICDQTALATEIFQTAA